MHIKNTYKRKCKSNNVGWKSYKINRNNKYNRNNDEHSNNIYRYGNIIRKKTAEIIVKNKGDYVLQLKENQKNLYEDVYAMFDDYHIQENTGR